MSTSIVAGGVDLPCFIASYFYDPYINSYFFLHPCCLLFVYNIKVYQRTVKDRMTQARHIMKIN